MSKFKKEFKEINWIVMISDWVLLAFCANMVIMFFQDNNIMWIVMAIISFIRVIFLVFGIKFKKRT